MHIVYRKCFLSKFAQKIIIPPIGYNSFEYFIKEYYSHNSHKQPVKHYK